ncbi:MAG TPA: class I SAM-dependent methyltransferase [Myxococcaceae bacterium]|nr:class I SAM-dependent methyltransferase [Myxococcaceae bacterium]
MSPAEAFPLFYPGDARRPFENDEAVRRFGRTANLANGARVLELACGRGTASVLLAREFGCEVVAVDSDEKLLQQLSERSRMSALSDRLSVRRADPTRLQFDDGEFDGIIVQGRILFPITNAVRALRRFLAPRGRLCLTYPARVGRFSNRTAVDWWEAKLGEQVLLPRELLQVFERSGFEPEGVETLSDAELADLYRHLEGKLDALPREFEALAHPLREEIELFRAQSARAGVTYAMVMGRRKEPGEKPRASRDRG